MNSPKIPPWNIVLLLFVFGMLFLWSELATPSKAYCSGDGANWMTCGQMTFPVEDPVQVGIYAIGNIGIRGGYKTTATRFDYFRMLKIVERRAKSRLIDQWTNRLMD